MRIKTNALVVKTHTILLLLLICCIIPITGCTKKDSKPSTETTSRNSRMPDFGQPEKQPDIMGIVKSITGNEATVLVLENEMRDRLQNKTEEDNDEKSPSALGGTTSGTGMGMGRAMGGGSRTEESRTSMADMLKRIASEEKTVTIPVGIQMLKPTPGKGPLEATLEDVKTDVIISIWLNQEIKDRNIAEFVLIKQ